MCTDNLHPLKVDPATGEVYLQLAAPYSHIVLTPQRRSDSPLLVQHFNDPRIYECLIGPPYPYLEEHARGWYDRTAPIAEAALADLRAGKQYVGAVPVCTIRDTRTSDGKVADAKIIGDMSMSRCLFYDMHDTALAQRLSEENAAKEVGDPSIVWIIGDWLDPAYHGQGIMTAVVRFVIHEWAVPRMNVRHIRVNAFLGNRGSVRVFEKNGFETLPDLLDVVRLSESRGGKLMSLHILEWHLEDDGVAH
ncbi:acyl-CoA N-acyltransferase [Exidia glandulosa HHB12029]|uniref:Acyl-CoA N-acyltransferase n=1 Tax=Exidia glandulosa HHB12029 TaxID=1314781 RepID=A0A165MBI1_EXIGL|nr:acyl-CoA N-acyltransferase [Exidia glandulosa HHB12029]